MVSTTFTLEQKSIFKLERNKDLTFIMIIIDIDWYEKNYRDNFFGHIAQPYINIYIYIYILNNNLIITFVMKQGLLHGQEITNHD